MQAAFDTFPKNIFRQALTRLREDLIRREALLNTMVQRFEARYGSSLETLESRLGRGEGQEHPDWEDSIEWRNAQDELQQTGLMKNILEWLLRSKMR
ncbi:MAG: hypothetical protein AB1846_01860 [Chloroflexota bacterium]